MHLHGHLWRFLSKKYIIFSIRETLVQETTTLAVIMTTMVDVEDYNHDFDRGYDNYDDGDNGSKSPHDFDLW